MADDVREALLARARVLMMPSPYESLSMVVLEAWNHGVPALVNARCAVLRGQVRRADGGLYYRTSAEFVAALDCLLERPDEARTSVPRGWRTWSASTGGRRSCCARSRTSCVRTRLPSPSAGSR